MFSRITAWIWIITVFAVSLNEFRLEATADPKPPTDYVLLNGEVIAVGRHARFYFLPNFPIVASEVNPIKIEGGILVQLKGETYILEQLQFNYAPVKQRKPPMELRDHRLCWKIVDLPASGLIPLEEAREIKAFKQYPHANPYYDFFGKSRFFNYSYVDDTSMDIYVDGVLSMRTLAEPPVQEFNANGSVDLLSYPERFKIALGRDASTGFSWISSTNIENVAIIANKFIVLEGEVFLSTECGMALVPCLRLEFEGTDVKDPEAKFFVSKDSIDGVVSLAKSQQLLSRFFKRHFDREAVSWKDVLK